MHRLAPELAPDLAPDHPDVTGRHEKRRVSVDDATEIGS